LLVCVADCEIAATRRLAAAYSRPFEYCNNHNTPSFHVTLSGCDNGYPPQAWATAKQSKAKQKKKEGADV